MSVIIKRKKKEEKEIPQWKRDMLAEADGGITLGGGSSKRPRPEDADAHDSERRRAADLIGGGGGGGGGGGCSSSYDALPPLSLAKPPLTDLPEDDDDDDDVDLSAYQLEEEKEEEVVAPGSSGPPPTAEELLNMREARYGVKKTKTFFLEDQANSLVGSLAEERNKKQNELSKAAGKHNTAKGYMNNGVDNHYKQYNLPSQGRRDGGMPGRGGW